MPDALSWSDKAPAKPGWYWVKGPDLDVPAIIKVSRSKIGMLCCIMPAGAIMGKSLERYTWSGPIPPPK